MEKVILWSNKNWTITDIGRKFTVMIDNHNSNNLTWHIDYALIYDNGDIVYDNNPYMIPKYVKNKVEVILRRKLQNSKSEVIENGK